MTVVFVCGQCGEGPAIEIDKPEQKEKPVLFGAKDLNIKDNAVTTLIHENQAIKFIDDLEKLYGKNRWFSTAKNHIEQGYIDLHMGLHVKQQEIESKSDPKSDAVEKLHQMAFDSIQKAVSSLQENNNDMSCYYLDKAINSIKCKMDVQYGNNPWDPR